MDLPTYTNIWRIEKRLYKLYDFRLPMPLPLGQIAVFTAIAVPYVVVLALLGLPFSHTLLWLYVLPPGVLAWFATRPVLESKRLPELVASQVRYLGEPRTWCRMAPLAEQDEIVVTARLWRRAGRAGQAGRAGREEREIESSAQPALAWAPAGRAIGSDANSQPRHAAARQAGPAAPPRAHRVAPGRRPAVKSARGTSSGPSAPPQARAAEQGLRRPVGATEPAKPRPSRPAWPGEPPGPRHPQPVPGADRSSPTAPGRVRAADPAVPWVRAVAAEPQARHAGPPVPVGRAHEPVPPPEPAGRPGAPVPVGRAHEPVPPPEPAGRPGAPVPVGRAPEPVPPAALPEPPAAAPRPPAPRPIVTVTEDRSAQRPVRTVERVLGNPAERRADGWRDRVVVVPGGHRPGQPDQLQRDRARARLPVAGIRRIVVLGCTVGAGQSVTTLRTGELLASLRDEPVAVLDLNPGQNSLSERARAIPALTEDISLAGRAGSAQAYPPLRLEVITSQPEDVADPGAATAPPAAMADAAQIFELLSARYSLTLADPAAPAVPRVLTIADQLLLVAPASSEAANAIAMTMEWLEAHGHAGLAQGAIMVLNGVSKQTVTYVEQAEAVASGRCRAIVRVPWDDQLRNPAVRRPAQMAPAQPHRPAATSASAAAERAYTALAGVLVASLVAAPEAPKAELREAGA